MTPLNKKRTSLGLLGASAALLVASASHEGFTSKAVIPTKGDVPVAGYGATDLAADDGVGVDNARSTDQPRIWMRA